MATERLSGSALKAWLLERVEMVPFSGCWIFMGLTAGRGYGTVYLHKEGRKSVYGYAHRLMYAAEFGEIPEGMFVLHRCDVPSCINPDHLFVGTHGDNVCDAVRKGRIRGGERHGMAKLTRGQVKEIRSRYAGGGVSQRDLAKEFGVAQSNISLIVNNKAWGWS